MCLLSVLFSICSVQNRYFPIITFSIHVYWRLNQSLDNPVCIVLLKYQRDPDNMISCRLNHLARPYWNS